MVDRFFTVASPPGMPMLMTEVLICLKFFGIEMVESLSMVGYLI